MDNNNPRRQRQQKLSLSLEQLRDVQDALRRPLAGRSVLIPLGSKAFIPGQLRPSNHYLEKGNEDDDNIAAGAAATTSTFADAAGSEDQKEYVSFTKMDGTQQHMTRQEAMAHLQEEMDSLRGKGRRKAPPPHHPTKEAQQQQEEAILKKEKTAVESSTATSSSKQQQQDDNLNHEDSSSILPYMEIREEYDETGQQLVWSEAIDVSKRLQMLEQQQQQQQQQVGAADEGTTDSSRTSNTQGIIINEDDESGSDVSVKEKPASGVIHDNNNNQQHVMSDQEYDALALRLDELARLEEEAEKSKMVNQASAKKLQSKGWSKGFLNTSSKKKPAKPASKESTAPLPRASDSEENDKDRKKVVGFHEETKVKEIPRVGERSVQELLQRPKHSLPPQEQQQPVKAPVPMSRTIEESVFSGVIRERRPSTSARNTRKASHQTTSSNNGASTTATTSSSSSLPQPKKVSRFVQQRRQLG